MSLTLITFVGIVYLSVSVNQWWIGNTPLALMYFGYAFANIGAYMLVAAHNN